MPYNQRETISGLADLLASLDSQSKAITKKGVTAGMKVASKMVLDKARAGAPRELGLMADSLGVETRVFTQSGVVVCIIGPQQGFRRSVIRRKGKWAPAAPPPSGFAHPLFYTHLIEHGVGPHQITIRHLHGQILAKPRIVVHPGFQAKPFLRPALTGQIDAIRKAIVDAINNVIK